MSLKDKMKNPQFASCIRILDILKASFSPRVEGVIHDLKQPGCPVIAIVNNQVTGRDIGDISSDFGYLFNMKEIPTFPINSQWTASNGNEIRSSTLSYLDNNDQPDFSLSFNQNISTVKDMINTLEQWFSYEAPGSVSPVEQEQGFATQEDLQNEIAKCMFHLNVNPKTIKKSEKKIIVQMLYEGGHFGKRGIISLLCQELNVSRPTIYRYLNEIRKNRST